MAAAGEAGQALFAELRKSILRENHEKVLAVCAKLRESGAGDDADVLRSECVALIELNRLEAALALAEQHELLAFEKAYTLYRMGRHEEALVACDAGSAGGSPPFEHLRAQLQYRGGHFAEAKAFYGGIALGEVDGGAADQREQDVSGVHDATVNYLAVLGNEGDHVGIASYAEAFGDDLEGDYEIAYNAGVGLCGGVEAGAAERLARAGDHLRASRELCVATLEDEGLGPDEVAEECGIMDIALSFVLSVQGLEKEAIDLCMNALQRKSGRPVDVCVAANNLTVFRGQRDLFDSFRRLNKALANAQEKLSPGEILTLRCNRCLLLLHMNKTKEFEAAMEELRREYPNDAHIFLMETALALSGGDASPAVAESLVDKAGGFSGHQAARVQLAAAQIWWEAGDEDRALAMVDTVRKGHPELASSPGFLATMMSILEATERPDEVRDVLNLVSKATPPTSRMLRFAVDHHIRLGDSHGAIQLLAEASDAGAIASSEAAPDLCALKTLAYSWLMGGDDEDAEEALDDAVRDLGISEADLDPETTTEEDDEVDIHALERSVPQRARRRGPRKADAPKEGDANAAIAVEKLELEVAEVEGTAAARDLGAAVTAKKQRGRTKPERVLAKRAKRKEAYLEKLAAEGRYNPNRPAKADPERWLPRKQRSYNKRGKRRNQFVGAQGSGDGAQKDAAKLDVAARVAEKLERGDTGKEAKSSAQAAVSSSSAARRTKKRGKKR